MPENLNFRRENLNIDVKLIKDVMDHLNLNQDSLAKKIGRTPGVVSQWINERRPIPKKMRKLLESLLPPAEERINIPNQIHAQNDKIEQPATSSILIRFPNEHGQTLELEIKGSVVMTVRNVSSNKESHGR